MPNIEEFCKHFVGPYGNFVNEVMCMNVESIISSQ